MGFTNTNGLNISTSELGWKLIYNDTTKEIIMLDKFEGVTKTKKDAYMSTDFKDIVTHIQTNSLNYNSIILNNYEYFHTEAMKDLTSPTNDDVIELIESFHPENWTLVYDNENVLFLQIEPIKIVSTLNVFTSSDITVCFDKITELSLNFPQQSEFEEIYPDYFGLE